MSTDQQNAPSDVTRHSDSPRTVRWLVTFLIMLLVTQRLAIPAGAMQLPLAVPLAVMWVGYGLMSRIVELDRWVGRAFCAAMLVLGLCAALHVALGLQPSITSLAFVAGLYVAALVRAPVVSLDSVRIVQSAYLRFMSCAAAVSLLQLAIQYSGLRYYDWLGLLLPAPVLLRGYNTGDPVTYGLDIIRSNAVIFLEPSFLSLFLGVAVLIALRQGSGLGVIALLLAGMVPTLAGSGLLVLGLGLLQLFFSPRRGQLLKVAGALLLAGAVAIQTPLADLYVNRATEVSARDTSTSQRFVQPYELLLPVWASTPSSILVGSGAGQASEVIDAADQGAVTTPLVPKLLVEYGAFGGAAFIMFLVALFSGGVRSKPWAPGLLFSYVALNAAFLQATLALATIFFISLLPAGQVRSFRIRQRHAHPPVDA